MSSSARRLHARHRDPPPRLFGLALHERRGEEAPLVSRLCAAAVGSHELYAAPSLTTPSCSRLRASGHSRRHSANPSTSHARGRSRQPSVAQSFFSSSPNAALPQAFPSHSLLLHPIASASVRAWKTSSTQSSIHWRSQIFAVKDILVPALCSVFNALVDARILAHLHDQGPAVPAMQIHVFSLRLVLSMSSSHRKLRPCCASHRHPHGHVLALSPMPTPPLLEVGAAARDRVKFAAGAAAVYPRANARPEDLHHSS
ncbi:hypothetical protein MSAN_02330300 [Mycena sanguinolenta]|uniref:Uncharacterized protein n=1 Tax=Mycena sanguinolenta TaxID=230812 RepID=A0A8H6X846_9AGAR|nr:hypothetical protein MSAN_02330300 [Mycena sanguinolenta]